MNENNSEDTIIRLLLEILEPHDCEEIFYEFSHIDLHNNKQSIAWITNHS